MTTRSNRRLRPSSCFARRVGDALKARHSQKTSKIKSSMEEYNHWEDDYKVPSSLKYPLRNFAYHSSRLMELLGGITCLADFQKLLEDFYEPDNGYGNYDNGTRNIDQPMMSIIYHLEKHYACIYTEKSRKTQIYGLLIHTCLRAKCDLSKIGKILIRYFRSLDDNLVRALDQRGFLTIFVDRLVEEHFKLNGGEEAAKLLEFLNELHGSYQTHLAWVISSVMNAAFSPLDLGRHHFTPGPTMQFCQRIFTTFSTQIATPTDEVIASLVREVVMGFEIGLDGLCKVALERYLPTTLASLQALHTTSGIGVEYLQNWMTILEERLAISTMGRNLTEAFSQEE